jgi:enterochelin esterase-like enzyme
MRRSAFVLLCVALVLSAAAAPQPAQPTQTAKGTYQRIKVHGKSLEGNLSGDLPDREVSIYLPPGYSSGTQRYPVVYMLHGFTDSDDKWFGLQKHFVNVPVAADKASGNGTREMILVMPNAFTAFQGSFYSNSVTTGDWERFVTRDLVTYIDGHYRTLANRASRGLAGHSMGGYGTLRIGMKSPEVFSAIYAMSACCLAPMAGSGGSPALAKAESIRSVEEVAKLDFGTKAVLACAAAWSPNPKNPPLFFDLPAKNGEPQPEVVAKWTANAPLAMVDQYVPQLKELRIALDVGDRDRSITTTSKRLSEVLDIYGVEHQFEVYDGDHVSGVSRQLETKVFPFFSASLVFK